MRESPLIYNPRENRSGIIKALRKRGIRIIRDTAVR